MQAGHQLMDGREKFLEKLPGCVVPPQGGRLVPTALLIELLELSTLWTSGMLQETSGMI